MSSSRVTQLKELLDRLLDGADLDTASAEQKILLEEAVNNFKAGGSGLLDEATESMWAYYKHTASEFSAAQRSEYGVPEIPETGDIWDEVQFRHPPELALGGRLLEPGRSYISFEGEVSWEPEHGLQLVFEDGLHVCKVGPYDGHLTNAHASGDESLLGVVFRHDRT